MRGSIRRPSPSLAISMLALAISLGGTGYAAVVLPAGSVGTAQLKNGAVVGTKVKSHSLVAANFKPGALPSGPSGPSGPVGLPGPAGPKGDPAAKAWAVVRGADGAIVRQSGGVVAAKPAGQGLYTLTFPQSVAECAPVVTVASTTNTPEEGFGSAATGAQPTQYTVQTLNANGGHENHTFSIALFC
jgi:hypothetical protein